MNASARVRQLSPDDVETIVSIALAAWEPVFEAFRRELGDDLFELVHAKWREKKAHELRTVCDPARAGHVLVATLGDRVVGFVSYYIRDSAIGVIGNNAVDPEWQNRGIATTMYGEAVDRLRRDGARYVRVLTGDDPAHAAARRAYEKAGFARKLPTITYWREL